MLNVVTFHLMAIVYLGFLLLYIWFKASRKVNIAFYIVGLYFLSVVGSLFLDSSLAVPVENYSLYATSLFLILLSLFFIPTIMVDSAKIETIYCPNYSFFDIICCIFIFIGFISYLYFIPIVYELLTSLSDLRSLRGSLVGGEIYHEINTLYLFITLGCQFYPIVLLFYFHSVCYRPEKKWFNRLLLFSSTAYIVNVLAAVGRDGFVLWTMSYIFTYVLYANVLPTELKNKVKRTLALLLCVFSIFFFAISISRFYREGSIYFLFQYLLVYFSQQFGEFNQFVTVVKDENLDIVKIFPFTKLFIDSVDTKSLLTDHENFLSQYGFSKYVFKTFLGMFYENLGLTITFLLSCFLSFIFSIFSFLGPRKNIRLGKLIMITMFSQITLHGIFYYKLGYMVSNIYMLICLMLAFIFSFRLTLKKV